MDEQHDESGDHEESQDDAESQEPELQLPAGISQDEKYYQLFISAIRKSLNYLPKLGTGKDTTYEQFLTMYSSDPFYHWIGLDSPYIYAAHKAAGGMTSIYRQIGIGGEWVFRAILQDVLGLTAEQTKWSYVAPIAATARQSAKTLTLDGRIDFADVQDDFVRERILTWAKNVRMRLFPDAAKQFKGVVFEVRQGYKSKDSKRQNADIANAAQALARDYIMVVVVLSQQIDTDLKNRYMENGLWVLTGSNSADPLSSTFAFMREIIGYDMAQFFSAYSNTIQAELSSVVKQLLKV